MMSYLATPFRRLSRRNVYVSYKNNNSPNTTRFFNLGCLSSSRRRYLCTKKKTKQKMPSTKPFKLTTKPGDIAKDFSPLRLFLEPVRDVTNRALAMADAPVRLNFVSSTTSDSSSKSVSNTKRRRKYTADSVVSTAEVDRYVRAVLSNPKDRVNNPLLPDIAERQIYALVVRVVLHLLHSFLGSFDRKRLMGRVISLSQRRSTESDPKRCDLNLDPQLLSTISESTASRRPLVSSVVDKVIYGSTVRFALRLLADIVSSAKFTMFGVRITCDASLCDGPLNLSYRDFDADWDETQIRENFAPIVASLLDDPQVNVTLIPDHLEEEFYYAIIGMLLNIAGAGVDDLQIDLFGVCASMTLEADTSSDIGGKNDDDDNVGI